MSGKGEDAGGCLMEGRVQLSLLLWRPGTSVLCAAGGQVPCSGTVLPDCACTTSPVSPVPGPTQGACHCLGGGSAGHVSKAPGSSDLLPRLRSTAHELVLQTCVCMCVRARVCMCVCAHMCPTCLRFACPHVHQSGPSFRSPHPCITEKTGLLPTCSQTPTCPLLRGTLEWPLPASGFLFALSIPPHSCLPGGLFLSVSA